MTLSRRPFHALLFSCVLLACGGSDDASSSGPTAGSAGSAGTAGSSNAGASGSGGSAANSTGGSNGGSSQGGSSAAGNGGSAAGGTGGSSGSSATGGTGGSSASGGVGGTGGSTGGVSGSGGSSAGSAGVGGSVAGSSGTGGSVDVCAGVTCPSDQHCVDNAGVGTCVDLTCSDLNCGMNEACDDPPNGGAYCRPTCQTDLDCPVSQYCGTPFCVDDVCTPGETQCQGDSLIICPPNGSGFQPSLQCGSSTLSGPACIDNGDGHAYCPCFDDWDCPAYTTCDAGSCQGTGVAPTCSLPPVPFAQALPTIEIQWGGTGSGSPANNAVGAPFPTSSQVSATPIVANLDDDNGDGLIDERDFPEIIFMTYCNTDISTNGIVRAIHGGGPNKGKDYFATCGATVWHEGDPTNMTCACANATGNSTAALAVGDIDGDGVPEIVVPNETAGLTILDNKGVIITQTAANQWSAYVDPAVSIANVDGTGFAELVVGRYVFTLGKDANNKLAFVDVFGGALMSGANGQGPISCVANITGDNRLEIVAGSTMYGFPTPPAGVTKRADCTIGDMSNFCLGKLDVVWDGQTVNGAAALPNAQRDGFCAVADVLGADETTDPSPTNPLDGKPEVILINEGYLTVLNGETGTIRRFINLGAGQDGGAPNVDDFDGDGFPEIGTAFGTQYIMIDLQSPSASCPAWPNTITDAQMVPGTNPARAPGATCSNDSDCAAGAVCNTTTGNCVCLHNGWRRTTEDDSSRVTGSSVFDFNGDGAAEVIYGDECFLRVYDGTNSQTLFKVNAPSRTRVENPVVADVDNDGNAEIVHVTNNDASTCSVGGNYPNGVRVLGDANDAWVSARRIWNQHAYHITNVNESGQIPASEPASWGNYNGRVYNTYRSNPRNYGIAPDLTVSGVQMSSPDAACGQLSSLLSITVGVKNQGDLRVGPGVVVAFYGEWTNQGITEPLYADAMQTPLTSTLNSTLDPSNTLILSVQYNAMNNSPGVLPDSVRVVVDDLDSERECIESNNEMTVPVTAGDVKADLTLELGLPENVMCPAATLPTTVFNNGSAAASNFIVRYYAGDPAQGGSAIHDELFAGPIAPFGGSEQRNVVLPNVPQLFVLVYGQVDPDNTVPECQDGNNQSVALAKIDCGKVE